MKRRRVFVPVYDKRTSSLVKTCVRMEEFDRWRDDPNSPTRGHFNCAGKYIMPKGDKPC